MGRITTGDPGQSQRLIFCTGVASSDPDVGKHTPSENAPATVSLSNVGTRHATKYTKTKSASMTCWGNVSSKTHAGIFTKERRSPQQRQRQKYTPERKRERGSGTNGNPQERNIEEKRI